MALQTSNNNNNNQRPCFDRLMQSNKRIQTWLKVKHLLNNEFSYDITKDHKARTESDQILLESNKQLLMDIAPLSVNIILCAIIKHGSTKHLNNLYDALKTIKLNASPKQAPFVLQKQIISEWECFFCNVQNAAHVLLCTKCQLPLLSADDLWPVDKCRDLEEFDPWPIDRCRDIFTNPNATKWEQQYAKMYIAYYQSLHFYSKQKKKKKKEAYQPFTHLSSSVICIICSFLSKPDIIAFKATNAKNAIVCLQQMTSIAVAVYNMNKLIRNQDHNKDVIKLNEEQFVSFHRYAPNTLFSEIFEAWNQLYDIPPNKQIVCSYDPSNYEHSMIITKAIENKTISSVQICEYCYDANICEWNKDDPNAQNTQDTRFIGPYLVFDTRNVTVLTPHNAQIMEQFNPLSMNHNNAMNVDHNELTLPALHLGAALISSIPNYSILILKYYDVIQKRLHMLRFICISKEVSFNRLFDYIENEYECNANHDWFDAFKSNVEHIRKFGGSLSTHKYSVCFEQSESMNDYNQYVPGINESSPVSVVSYLSALDDEFVKQIMVFRFNRKSVSFLQKKVMEIDEKNTNNNSKQRHKETPGNPSKINRIIINHKPKKRGIIPETIKKANNSNRKKKEDVLMKNNSSSTQKRVKSTDATNNKPIVKKTTKAVESTEKYIKNVQYENRLQCLQTMRQENDANSFDVCLILCMDQKTNPLFVRSLFKQIQGLNDDNDNKLQQFMNNIFKSYTFRCCATRNFGILRLELGTKLGILPKHIDIFSRNTSTNKMHVQTWRDTVEETAHYEWRLVAYDTRIWSDNDCIYRLKLHISDVNEALERYPKEINSPLFIKHKSRFKVEELIRLMNDDIVRYHSSAAYDPKDMNLKQCIITSLSRCYASSEWFSNTFANKMVTDLNVFIIPSNNMQNIDFDTIDNNEKQFILHIRLFDGYPGRSGVIASGTTSYMDGVSRLVGIPYLIKCNKGDNLQTVIDNPRFPAFLRQNMFCCYKFNASDSAISTVQRKAKSYAHIDTFNKLLAEDINECLVVKLKIALDDYQDANNVKILRNITNLQHDKSNDINMNKHKDKKKKKRKSYTRNRKDIPPNRGKTEIPQGNNHCFTGMRFVITGQLPSLTREDCTQLIQKYGGRVTGAISGLTKYLIKGEEAGATKMKKANEKKTLIIDEAQFLDLLRNLPEKDPSKTSAKRPKVKKKKKASLEKAETTPPLIVTPTSKSRIGKKPTIVPSSTAPNRPYTRSRARKRNMNSNNNNNNNNKGKQIEEYVWFYINTPSKHSLRIKLLVTQPIITIKPGLENKYGRNVTCFRFNGKEIEPNTTAKHLMNSFGAIQDDHIEVVYK